MKSTTRRVATFLGMMLIALLACQPTFAADKPFTFGLLMVGPANDKGWSQAHFDAAREIEKNVPGTQMIYIDKVNPADRPGITVPTLVDDLVAKGAKLIIGNSDDMKDGMQEAALMHPDIYFVHISGDGALKGEASKNLSNLMGRMEYGKMMAGFVAALTTKTGKIGDLGPLINAETRRLSSSTYLGARYAWTHILKKPLKDLHYKVSWIGFWFNIPGVTSDPTLVMRNFIDSGYDVIVSGIDTTEALIVAGQKRKEGATVWAVPYDYKGACNEAPEACLGVPYFNWYPGYKDIITSAMNGKFSQQFLWLGPDWKDINNAETSAIGFQNGAALSAEHARALADFQQGLADGSIHLFTGPLNFQDGSVFLKTGESATDTQIWNLPQLLEGMEGASK